MRLVRIIFFQKFTSGGFYSEKSKMLPKHQSFKGLKLKVENDPKHFNQQILMN